jgi:tetratricopeptide (TPR) repeat protein
MLRRRSPRRRSLVRRRALRRPPPAIVPRPGLRPRPALPPLVREALARANRLMADGQFAEAAAAFESLAAKAKEHNLPGRAADLTLQAARAHFAAGHVDAAVERAIEALRLLTLGGRAGRVPAVLSKTTAALRDKGYDAQADRLEQETERILGEVGLSLEQAQQQAPQAPEKPGTLPAKCDGCGAPVIPDEVEWHDAQTAECLYCGTVLKAT